MLLALCWAPAAAERPLLHPCVVFPPFPSCFLLLTVFLLAHKADTIRKRFLRAQNRFLASCPSCTVAKHRRSPSCPPWEPLHPRGWVLRSHAMLLRAILQLGVYLVSCTRLSVTSGCARRRLGFLAQASQMLSVSTAEGAERSWCRALQVISCRRGKQLG